MLRYLKKGKEVKDGSTYTTYFFLTDERGNIVALTDNSGNILERYRYRVYGEHEVINSCHTACETTYDSCFDLCNEKRGQKKGVRAQYLYIKFLTFSTLKVVEIAELSGMNPVAAGELIRRFGREIKTSKELVTLLNNAEKLLNE